MRVAVDVATSLKESFSIAVADPGDRLRNSDYHDVLVPSGWSNHTNPTTITAGQSLTPGYGAITDTVLLVLLAT